MPHRKLKLKKYLNKSKRYSATVSFTKDSASGMTNTLLLNICIKGKQYTDHAWVNASYVLKSFPEDSEIFFNATVKSYKSDKGETKYGLHKIHNPNFAEHEDQVQFAETSRDHKRKHR